MSADDHKALFRRYFAEGTNQGSLSVVDEVFATDYLHHDPANVDSIGGLDDVKHHIVTLRSAFPDLQFHINDEITDGDDIVVRWTATGTHTGDYFGIPPTGKAFSITGMNHWKMANGKTIEGWVSRD
ncbi:MAG: ester cyclase, partial [Chloroflexota bacterium]